MWNEKVTLFIDDTSIRLLVSSGQRIKKWVDLKLEPGLVKDAVVVEEAEVAARIKTIFRSQNIKTKKIILGYSGLHSLTRPAVLPQLPKSMVFEAVAREARRVLPLSLDQLYLSWRRIPCPKGRIQVFMVATPRKTADSLVSTIHQAGLEAYRMAIKPLSLTQALSKKTGILVDLQLSEFDIVINSNGIAQPIRTIALPEEELPMNKKIDMIADELDRTLKFFESNNPEKPIHNDTPVYVSGELANQVEMQKLLSDSIGHSVVNLVPDFKGIEQIDIARYMFNLTMAFKPSLKYSEEICPAGNLNVLPAPYQPKPMSLMKVMGIPAGVSVISLVIPMVMALQSTSANTDKLQDQLNVTNQMIKDRNMQKSNLTKAVNELANQATLAKTTFDNLNLSLTSIHTQQEHIHGDLSVLFSLLPSDINLQGISDSGNILTITGTAPDLQDAYRYAQAILQFGRSMDSSNRFTETTLTSLNIAPPDPLDGELTTQPEQTQPTSVAGKISFTLIFKRGD